MAIVFCPVVLFCCWIIFLLLKLNDHFIQQGIRKSVYDIREIMEAVLGLMISFLYECKINLFHFMLCILLIGIPNPEIFYKRTDLKKSHFFFISFAVRFFWHKTIALNCKTDNKYGI